MRRLNGQTFRFVMTHPMCAFPIRVETSQLARASVPTRSSGLIGHWASIYRKRYMRIWRRTSLLIRENGSGFRENLIATSITVAYQISWYFSVRKGESLPTTTRPEDYSPGDIVTYDLGGNVPHIGIVVDRKGARGRYMI